jgi:hypothetical protein
MHTYMFGDRKRQKETERDRKSPFCRVTKELVSGGGNHFYKHGSPDHITERQIERDRKRQKETERDRKRQKETERYRKYVEFN